jgi:hypothetical protein
MFFFADIVPTSYLTSLSGTHQLELTSRIGDDSDLKPPFEILDIRDYELMLVAL